MSATVSDKQRFSKMAEVYDAMAPYLVPQYEFMQDEVISISGVDFAEDAFVVDLGAGSGRLLEKIMDRNETARCVWVDSSEDFLQYAAKRLARFGDRVEFALSAIEDNWESRIGNAPDCIFSMSAIHHLESAEKLELYRRCFEILADRGWFINAGEMKTVYNDSYLASLKHWARHCDGGMNTVPPGRAKSYAKWQSHFDRWKHRNIERIDKPKAKGDDLHDPFTDQMAWLHEAGFANVDVFVKYHLWSVIGGQKGGRIQ